MIYSKSLVVWVGLALATLGGGCKSADDDPPPIALDQFPQTFAKALCDAVAPCCSQASLAYTSTECQGAATEQFTSYVSRTNTGRTRYDADAAGRCLAALRQSLQDCHPDSGGEAACDAVFVGTVANGQACDFSAECQSRRCLDAVCIPPIDHSQHAKLGDPCAGDCLSGEGDGQCRTLLTGPNGMPGSGGYCFYSDGLYCRPDFSMDGLQTSTSCTAFAKLGEPCADAVCGPGSYCDFAQAVCVAQKDSGPCESPTVCSSKSYCDNGGGFGTGQCVARKPDGFACTSGEECANGSCSGGTEAHRSCGTSRNVTASECSGDF